MVARAHDLEDDQRSDQRDQERSAATHAVAEEQEHRTTFVDLLPMHLYQQPRQAASAEPSDWENELGDAIESAFTNGAWELEALVEQLNASRVRPREGGPWTAERFLATVRELGA
jgi:hypothetical protein